MKFDKAQLFVLIVGVAILLAWDPVCKYMGWFQVPVDAPKVAEAPAKAVPAADAQKSGAAPAVPKKSPAVKAPKLRSVAPMQPVVLSNSDLKLIIDPVSASVIEYSLFSAR